ncbi:MAG TPA: class II aldolase/adducin family protein [Sphingomonas sp.]|nr:class II aldolase/adducin family protein [Sphingomonas sp.]
MTQNSEISALRRLSARIGRDPTLVQGAGGNISIKLGDTLWIKASGTWLADADRDDILVPVMLPVGDRPIVHPDATTPLRPSIETTLHAALPHRVVVHVHSVDAIAHAVRRDAADDLADRLTGLAWAWIPYRQPGPALAAAIVERLDRGGVDILVLANHGLVVAAPDVAGAAALLDATVARLALAPRGVAPPSMRDLPPVTGYHAVDDPAVHGLAVDPIGYAIATGAPLYPDHVVFLGIAPLVVDAPSQIAGAIDALIAGGQPLPRWIVVRDRGVMIADDALRGSDAMLRCLADVAARLPAAAGIETLTDADVAALIDWDAERYRRALAAPFAPANERLSR